MNAFLVALHYIYVLAFLTAIYLRYAYAFRYAYALLVILIYA